MWQKPYIHHMINFFNLLQPKKKKKKFLTHLICQLSIKSKWHFPKKKKSLLIYIYILSAGKKKKKKKEKETTTLGSYFFQIPIIRFYNFLSKKKKREREKLPKSQSYED